MLKLYYKAEKRCLHTDAGIAPPWIIKFDIFLLNL